MLIPIDRGLCTPMVKMAGHLWMTKHLITVQTTIAAVMWKIPLSVSRNRIPIPMTTCSLQTGYQYLCITNAGPKIMFSTTLAQGSNSEDLYTRILLAVIRLLWGSVSLVGEVFDRFLPTNRFGDRFLGTLRLPGQF